MRTLLRRPRISGDLATTIGFVLVALAAVLVAFATEIIIHAGH